ncbi:class I SAM-dependent rRNA methyltransferase, partial [uncultured Marinobacter sp.]|uniref:class I SAM-dependent rRNA methyltransferase n=1 Tax=uncultured Marinobacter sp. TaxID=187379 RepID=UPI0030DD1175
FVNPHALICGRLISRNPLAGMTPKRLTERLELALELRDRVFPEPWYRWVFGDGDGLSGLVIDRFGDVVVVQISTAGMESMKDTIIKGVQRLVHPRAIVLKNDGKMRSVEGLPSYVEQVSGDPVDVLEVRENGVRFEVPLSGGQKTGWFYDHRMNRARLQQYAKGKRVLDVFSYAGGWGLQAAAAGAASVTCLDSSAQALASVRHNAALNGLTGVDTLEGDAFEVLKQLCDDKQKYDIVVLDPPSLIPRRRDMKAGEQAYARLNQLGLRLLERDGLLVSASCSMHLSREKLVDIIRGSGRKVDRFVQLLEQGYQGPDHPMVPGIPETDYLKACFVRSLTEFL